MYISWEGVGAIIAVLMLIGGALPFVVRAIVRDEITELLKNLDARFLATNIADLKFQPLTQLSARIDALEATSEASIKAEAATAEAGRHKLASRIQVLEFEINNINTRLEHKDTGTPPQPSKRTRKERR